MKLMNITTTRTYYIYYVCIHDAFRETVFTVFLTRTNDTPVRPPAVYKISLRSNENPRIIIF